MASSVRAVIFVGGRDTSAERQDDERPVVLVTEADDLENPKLPGGKQEDKSPWEAIVDELWTELGVTPEQVALRGIGRLVNREDSSDRHIYVGEIEDLGQLRQPGDPLPEGLEILPGDMVIKLGAYTLDMLHGQNETHIRDAVLAARGQVPEGLKLVQ